MLCTKHAGKSSDSSVGWTIYRNGSQIKTTHVVKFTTLMLLDIIEPWTYKTGLQKWTFLLFTPIGGRSELPLRTNSEEPYLPPTTWKRPRLCVTVWPSWFLASWGEAWDGYKTQLKMAWINMNMKRISEQASKMFLCCLLQVYWLYSAPEGEVWERLQPRD